jgi:hypothetical protein
VQHADAPRVEAVEGAQRGDSRVGGRVHRRIDGGTE